MIEIVKNKFKGGNMLFCDKCGSLMVPDEDGAMKCPACGFSTNKKAEVVSEKIKQKEESIIVGEDEQDENLPVVAITCEKCNNNEAYYWVVQTRAADEAPTRFYKCTKCAHTWREYD